MIKDGPMNGSEIAKRLGISRQAVSYSIRKSMGKLYDKVWDMKLASSPFDAVVVLMSVLNVDYGSVEDVVEFTKLFDEKIISKVKADALSRYHIRGAV